METIIARITDEMFGDASKEFNNPIVRKSARGIALREDGQIAIFNKKHKNEYKLPGGGIDEGETPEEAFKREIMEETGSKLKDIQFLGITEELKSFDNFQQISYVYIARVIETKKELSLTQKEIEEGGELIWMFPEDALKEITECANKIIESKYENLYHSKFINYRDREILRFFIKKFNK